MWFTLRFHTTTYTSRPDILSHHIACVYEEYCHRADGVYGSLDKLTAMKRGDSIPAWEVDEVSCPNLHKLLKELRKLCGTHYAAVDFEQLKQYGNPVPLEPVHATSAPQQIAPPREKRSVFRMSQRRQQWQEAQRKAKEAEENEKRKVQQGADQRTAIAATPTTTQSAPAVGLVAEPGRLALNTHQHVLGALFAVLDDSAGWIPKDKIHDQMKDLRPTAQLENPRPVDSSCFTTQPSTGVKRKAADDGEGSAAAKYRKGSDGSRSGQHAELGVEG